MKTKEMIVPNVVIRILIILLSVFVLAQYTTSTRTNAKMLQSLNDKKGTVMALAGASTAASTAISLLPDDTGSPLANELADLTSYFIIILSAIYLEEFLLGTLGFVSFWFLIPVAMLFSIDDILNQRDRFRELVKKMVIIGLALVLTIPASEMISMHIENVYGDEIQATIEKAQNGVDEAEETEGGITGFISKIKDSVTGAAEWVQDVLNDFIEAIAVMIITCCVLPVLTLLLMVWFIRFITGVNVNLPALGTVVKMQKKISGGIKGANAKISGKKLHETKTKIKEKE